MKIALLGAGHIGQTIARLLHNSGDYAVSVFDQSQPALAKLAGGGIRTQLLGTGDAKAVSAAIEGHDALVNALPLGHWVRRGCACIGLPLFRSH